MHLSISLTIYYLMVNAFSPGDAERKTLSCDHHANAQRSNQAMRGGLIDVINIKSTLYRHYFSILYSFVPHR